eukprot:15133396-Alexandrium_andersonii.AAC.1
MKDLRKAGIWRRNARTSFSRRSRIPTNLSNTSTSSNASAAHAADGLWFRLRRGGVRLRLRTAGSGTS